MSCRSLPVLDILNPGTAHGTVLKLSEPLSFWGGFNPVDGRIIDQSHPEVGKSITGTILALPGSRGSAGTPGGVAEALRRNVGPVAILLAQPDVNITIGAQVADHLYATETPVLALAEIEFAWLETGMQVTVSDVGVAIKEDGGIKS
ncbi:MAG: DUF126 domain-containing protein [Arenicellales bacterium]|nr:DUF126 domain-containing protein [Arenicellales bacterium]